MTSLKGLMGYIKAAKNPRMLKKIEVKTGIELLHPYSEDPGSK